MSAPDPARLAGAWAIGAVLTVTPTEAGHNNRSWVIQAERGKFVLRLHDNLGEAAISSEHALLQRLGAVGLPFGVPVPVALPDGETLLRDRDGDREIRGALFPFLPGTHPTRDDPVAAPALGEALAHLHAALRRVAGRRARDGVTGYADLHRIHPLVPDPLAAAELAEFDDETASRLRRATERSIAAAPPLYAVLPQQQIHSDYGCFNVFMEDGRVSAVLDFEFSSWDVRAMDLASGLREFGWGAWSGDGDLDLCERFVRAYTSVQPLAPEEINALPELQRLAVMAIFVHWVGRWRKGVTSRAQLNGLAEWALTVDAAMDRRGPELVERLLRVIQ